VLTGELAEWLHDLVRETCEAFGIRIVKGVVSKDHVHIIVIAPPNIAPSEIMWRIKGRTSSKLFGEYPNVKERYWGRHFRARGYFCATAGQMTEELIKQYLEHHFVPKPNDGFKMELN
jgi:putative transposase